MVSKKEIQKKEIIKDLLKAYDLLDEQISKLNFHLNILSCRISRAVSLLSDKGLIDINICNNEYDIAKAIHDLIKKCDETSIDFDDRVYVEIARIGNHSDNFFGGHNHNKWNTGNFDDDDFGFGRRETDLYDDYIDRENDKKHY